MGMPLPITGTTSYNALLGFPDKGCAIKELVFWRVFPIHIKNLFQNVFFQSGYYYYGSVDGTNFYASDVNCAGKIIFILIFV